MFLPPYYFTWASFEPFSSSSSSVCLSCVPVPGDAPSSALFVDPVFPLALTATTLGLANYATLGNGSDAFYRVTFDQVWR